MTHPDAHACIGVYSFPAAVLRRCCGGGVAAAVLRLRCSSGYDTLPVDKVMETGFFVKSFRL